MNTCKAPLIIPKGWKEFIMTEGNYAITKQKLSGLCALLSIDTYDNTCVDLPPMGKGEYFHISISRRDSYPEWDEMRDFIYNDCPFFDNRRDVIMILPPFTQYVNVHNNCFHFYQKIIMERNI